MLTMCYRYAIYTKPERIETKWQVTITQEYTPRYHVSAFTSNNLPIITQDKQTEVQLASWGLIPHWAKTINQAEDIRQKTVNARSETIFKKPSFRHAASKNHCLVIADGFFEWREVNQRKYPYYIRLKNQEPFAMAGLWEPWTNPDTDEMMITYTIITTDANPLMAKIHNTKKRMPVILPDGFDKLWLNTFEKDKAGQLLVPFEQGKMEAYTISKLITARDKDPNVSQVLSPFVYPDVKPRYP